MKHTTPLPCPICGRQPKFRMYKVYCFGFSGTGSLHHELEVSSPANMRPVAQWNAYVRRIRARIAKENAK